jgi:hypothetical protein
LASVASPAMAALPPPVACAPSAQSSPLAASAVAHVGVQSPAVGSWLKPGSQPMTLTQTSPPPKRQLDDSDDDELSTSSFEVVDQE